MSSFRDKIAVVTGASSGIGRRTAERLAQMGARVAVFARTGRALEELAAQFPKQMLAVAGDISSADDVDALFDRCESELGPCELLVNSAGLTGPVAELSHIAPGDWDQVFAVNVRGTYLAVRRALRSMRRAGRGSIVNVASISGIAGTSKFPGLAPYVASKAAVVGFTEAVAAELRGTGIRMNSVSPGSVDTEMLRRANPDAKPDMTPDEVADTILFLLSERSRPIHGQNLHVFSS